VLWKLFATHAIIFLFAVLAQPLLAQPILDWRVFGNSTPYVNNAGSVCLIDDRIYIVGGGIGNGKIEVRDKITGTLLGARATLKNWMNATYSKNGRSKSWVIAGFLKTTLSN
jgi:hypothetical protein